ncbi:TonB-linked SusC/RagA family outer membrane protein [Filimonas zeae]|uniref:SusC/RagA family TonB-linked outer membrane protein n=1 Tax=Filimonas zeae TaxID=1737353 RepID=A0A917MUX3_9BACT|nr:SusC/RagA family TonB-linked outer membrane protein [Filimonas zeae]MDR6338989.1 TonB-linked SusC/RagA family outer membrane protein [Filimonas zeae]GGH65639.1 SusC/RagA family TonB-linked outer membrane protein [Filimonas zeae]
MKITAVFKKMLLLIVLASSQQLLASQFFTISVKKVTFKQAAIEIKAKTGYVLLYNEEQTGMPSGISIQVKDGDIDEIMHQCLSGLPLSYVIAGKNVVIKAEAFKRLIRQTDDKVLSGYIFDEIGGPLGGATIAVKGKKMVTASANNGKFTLAGVSIGDVLVVSYVGFATQEVAVLNFDNKVIKLSISKSQLDNVEIIAYGSTTRRLSTGNSSSVKAADIEKQPINNPLLALQGRAAGVVVTQSTGMPGATLNVRIQGTNSLMAGNNPFYVVDGVPYTSALLATSGGSGIWGTPQGRLAADGSNIPSLANEGSGNPFSYLNPADIESIEVLKDADATAIYGSRAANGAILITTKKGKTGQTRVDFNLKAGWQNVAKKLQLLNVREYLDLRREAKRNSNEAILSTDYDLNGTWDTTRATDWQKEIFGNGAGYFDGQITVSGGNNSVNYLIGGGVQRQTTVLPGDFSDKKASMHFSLRSSSANQRFKIQLSSNYMVDNNTLPTIDPTAYAISLSPVAPALYNADGSLNWALNSSGRTTWPLGHPFAELNNKLRVNVNNLVSSLVLGYMVLPNLELKTSMGYTYMQSNEIASSPLSAKEPALRNNSYRQATFTYNNITSYITEPQLNYRLSLGKGKLDALAGVTIQQNNSRGRSVTGMGQISDNMMENLSAATSIFSSGELATNYRYNAFFGRFNYNYLDKYIVNFNGRRDGSSRFGIDNRFHNFGSVAGAWLFSNESLIHLPKFLTFGKLKASYGTTGNDQLGDYTYMDLYGAYPVGVPYQGIPSLVSNGLFNSKLQWEINKKLNMGLDLGFWGERILLGVNYSRNRSSNLLQRARLPITAGFPSVIANFNGIVQNTSLEVTLSTVNFRTSSFSWNTNFNLTLPKNKLASFPDRDKLTNFNYQLDGPLGARRVLRYGGVNTQTGVYMFKNTQGDLVTAQANADFVFVNMQPRLYGGLDNSFSYKGIRLDVLFQFTKQNAQRFLMNDLPGRSLVNQPVSVLNRWRKPGDIALIQRASSAFISNPITLTDAAFEDGSFIRCKNVSVSWELPAKWISVMKMNSCRIALNTQNLFTWTKYSGIDPESGASALPPMRVFVLGVQAGF